MNEMSSSSLPDEDPSAVLRSLRISLPSGTLVKLLENRLFTVLDALPAAHKTTVSNALAEVKRDTEKALEKLSAIKYDIHKKSLDDNIKALYKDVKRDWAYGADRQAELM
jgi:hypothetical protein